jgi:ribosomal protein S18 acetylase RimI-like enzyme
MEIRPVRRDEAAKALYRGLGFGPTGERRSLASDPTRAGGFMARPL